ncbi:MAG: mercuric transporter MerT family protein [Hyphomicrobiaceae bacterium]
MMNDRIAESAKDVLLATGGVLGALAAASCCMLPFALAAVGIGGAWIGTLTTLAPYRPAIVAAAGVCIGVGLWRAYARSPVVCNGAECGLPVSRRTAKAALWLAAALLAAAGSAEWWGRFLA